MLLVTQLKKDSFTGYAELINNMFVLKQSANAVIGY